MPFNRLGKILTTPETCLYVHCESGGDRSAWTVFALLRLQFSVSKDEARNAVLRSRTGKDGNPCAQLRNQWAIMKWIDQCIVSESLPARAANEVLPSQAPSVFCLLQCGQ